MKITYFLLSLVFWCFDFPVSLGVLREFYGVPSTFTVMILGSIDYLVELFVVLAISSLIKRIRLGEG
ncbi:hypothetical protein [Metallosphaera sp.]|uniref:hypothetical protein n=1 Tax=Metallosphaera sp. TaxID=2020860 RepID=UPI003160FD3F